MIRLMKEQDKNEVIEMMTVFYASEAVSTNGSREIFERNTLEYYILLPDEMNEETYKNILKKYLKEVA